MFPIYASIAKKPLFFNQFLFTQSLFLLSITGILVSVMLYFTYIIEFVQVRVLPPLEGDECHGRSRIISSHEYE